MKPALALALTMLVAACGQTGSLYLPDESVETPVEIRAPATPAPADEDEEKKDSQPPAG